MMNREYMKQTYADNVIAWREYRTQIAQDAETLCEIVQKHRFSDGTPEQAAREIVQTIGAENARVIIASAVNAHKGDGRLSAAVIEWAQGIGWDREMSCNLGLTLDSKMHMCHINQTAEALMNLPEDEPERERLTAGTENSARAHNIKGESREGKKMKNAEFIATLNAVLATAQNRSAWDRGVQEYAEEIAEEIGCGINGGYIAIDDLRTRQSAEAAMLNGAESWHQYSWGGSSLIYNSDIAKRLCTPSEYRKTRGGERRPNSSEEWLDCQARALSQASRRVYASIRETFRQLDG